MNKKKQKLGPSEKIIQLYAKVSDIIRTEHRVDIDFVYQGRDSMPMGDKVFSVEDLIKDIDDKGILDALKIKADGTVMRGNTRCEVAGIKNLEYLPIDLGFFIGLFHGDKEYITTIRKIIYEQEIETMNTGCRLVKPPTTEEYRKKVGRIPGDRDYLINWSDEFVLLQSHFEQEGSEKNLLWLSRILNHWKGCDIDPTKKENCKWCNILFNAELSLKKELKKEEIKL